MKYLLISLIVMLSGATVAGSDFSSGLGYADDADAGPGFQDCHRLAQQGDAYAQTNLGLMYANGQGAPASEEQALRWLQLAARQGHAGAQASLGLIYSNGHSVARDYARALYWYKEAAASGFAAAQFNLGYMYAHGLGVEQDLDAAAMWYRRAAEQGNASAQYKLGMMYSKGFALPQDFGKAVYWFTKAASQGNAGAQFNLGLRYLHGEGVEQDTVAAYKLLLQASFNIGKNARDSRELVDSQLTGEQIEETQRGALLASRYLICQSIGSPAAGYNGRLLSILPAAVPCHPPCCPMRLHPAMSCPAGTGPAWTAGSSAMTCCTPKSRVISFAS
jgi:hypothetical protein